MKNNPYSNAIKQLRFDEAFAEKALNRLTARRARGRARWLIPVAAVFVSLIVLMSMPGVSQAVKGWFYDIFRADRYLYVPADERTHNPELDGAIVPAGELEQTNEVLLLSETEEYDKLNAARKENGHPAYDPAEWAWLADIEPVITDVYYDGVDFMVMTFFPCDPRPFMSGFISSGISPMRLDILTFDTGTIKNLDTGEMSELHATGHGLTPQKDYRNEDGSANVEAMLEDGGVWLYDEYLLPYQKQLAPGRYRIEITHRILDDHVGEMSPTGTIAVCRQSFVLDTRKALAAIEEEDLPPVAFSGTYPGYALTYRDEGGTQYRPITVDLDGLSVAPRLQKRPTGIRVMLDYTKPSTWDGTLEGCEVRGGGGLEYELFVDGVSMGLVFIEGNGTELWIDIPMTASERASCRSLVLKPVYVHYTAFTVDGVEYPLSEGQTLPASGFSIVTENIPIEGCDITLPVG